MRQEHSRPTIVFHTPSGFLDHVPAEVERLSRFADVHLVIEVTPGSWSSNMLDLPPVSLAHGMHDARDIIRHALPEQVWRSLSACAGIWYAVYPRLARPGTAAAVWAVAAKVRSLHPDLLHFNGESPRCALWLRLARVPYVVSVHEPYIPKGSRLLGTALAQRMLVPGADRLIAHSETCRAALIRRWKLRPEAVVVAPLGAYTVLTSYCECDSAPDESAAPRSERLRVTLWGWIGPRKGVDVYLRAAEIASASLHNVTFVSAGRCCDGYSYPQLPELPNGCRFEIVERRLSNSELCRIVRATDLVALPYRDAMQSGVALTAFGFGKPLVGSAVGGLLEQVEQGVTGELFPAGDAEAMARALVAVLCDTERLKRMTAAVASVWDAERSWDAYEHGVRAAYSEVLRKRYGDQ